MSKKMPQVIFMGNGALAEGVMGVLEGRVEVIFWARKAEDLETVAEMKRQHPGAYGVLASFGVLIKTDLLELFEPEGILNLHPSLLPDLRGPSPIETAMLRGDTRFGISVMKLVKAMDAGPIYCQTTLEFGKTATKAEIYEGLARAGAEWLVGHLTDLPEAVGQDAADLGRVMAEDYQGWPEGILDFMDRSHEEAGNIAGLEEDVGGLKHEGINEAEGFIGERKVTYCHLLSTAQSRLDPVRHTARELYDQVRAFQGFPKSRMRLFGRECVILEAEVLEGLPEGMTMVEEGNDANGGGDVDIRGGVGVDRGKEGVVGAEQGTVRFYYNKRSLVVKCAEGYLGILRVQPEGRRGMGVGDFVNGYGK